MGKPVDLKDSADTMDFDMMELKQFVNRKTAEIEAVHERTLREAEDEEP